MKIVGIFLEYNGKFVIVLRHPHKPNGNLWGLPAGKVEPDETETAAALRELHEETGYQAQESELEHLNTRDYGDPSYNFAAYRVKLAQPYDVKLEDSAHAEFRWVTGKECDTLPNLVPDFHELLKVTSYV